MTKFKILLIILWTLLFMAPTYACDVYVSGYYRSDGTYVRGHCRSRPDSHKWNNYGPSRSTRELTNPYLRDNDRDGIGNLYDYDDDNDGILDDYDSTQYGGYKRQPRRNYDDAYDRYIQQYLRDIDDD